MSIYDNVFTIHLNPCHTRVVSLKRSLSVLENCRSPWCALCSRHQRCVRTVCNRIERHATAFILSILKINAAAGRLQGVLDSALWGLLERRGRVVGAPRARCKDAM